MKFFPVTVEGQDLRMAYLGVAKVAVVGHSMGGMLAVRFALLHPSTTARLVLENPIGLEDYRVKVPFTNVDATYRGMLNPTRESLDRFYRTYFAIWKPAFGIWTELATLGRYPELGRRAQAAIPGAKLAELDGVGHIPHLEAPDRLHMVLLDFLK